LQHQRQALLTGGPDGNGRKYSEEDVTKIEALMQKKGIPIDYEDAAILYAATLPPENTKPSDVTPPGATWELPAFAEYSKDPNKAARNNAYAVIDEFRRRRA
jgi:hypothetical protein